MAYLAQCTDFDPQSWHGLLCFSHFVGFSMVVACIFDMHAKMVSKQLRASLAHATSSKIVWKIINNQWCLGTGRVAAEDPVHCLLRLGGVRTTASARALDGFCTRGSSTIAARACRFSTVILPRPRYSKQPAQCSSMHAVQKARACRFSTEVLPRHTLVRIALATNAPHMKVNACPKAQRG